MKAILLYVNDDAALDSRLQAAIELTRTFSGHLTCLQITPYEAFIAGDPFGSFYASPAVVEKLGTDQESHRRKIEARLAQSEISWDWYDYNGQAASILVHHSRLADLVVISISVVADGLDGPLTLAADVALHAQCCVLAVPPEPSRLNHFNTAVVAWNGSAEAGRALRLATPMLRHAKDVHIISVKEADRAFPAPAAERYLALQGIRTKLHERFHDGDDVAGIVLDSTREVGGDFIVMGAYGHSRIREAVLGGVTRSMLRLSEFPLLLAH